MTEINAVKDKPIILGVQGKGFSTSYGPAE